MPRKPNLTDADRAAVSQAIRHAKLVETSRKAARIVKHEDPPPEVVAERERLEGSLSDWMRYHGGEALIHGPAETGKTISALWKLHLCALKYPNASLVIARKTQASIYGTVLRTYTEKVLGDQVNVSAYGGGKPEWFDYPNGARIWIAGLDTDWTTLVIDA